MGHKPALRYECPLCKKKYATPGECDCRIALKRIRTGEFAVLWEGEQGGTPIRIVAVDKGTVHSTPCLIVFERGTKNAVGGMNWVAMEATNDLEAVLGYELGFVCSTLPEWAKEEE